MARPAQWKALALRLAEALPKARLEPRSLDAAAGLGRARWGVALSGGCDSVALLLLLWAHFPERRGSLVAFHFDHRLRGKASSADAGFCRSLCASLGVPFVLGRWSAATPGASEGQARQARLAFLDAEGRRRKVRLFWFGHHADDVAETLLMRLARGSGTSGLAAPRPVQRMPGERLHLRPLLPLRKRELVSLLTGAGVPWREDASNEGGDYFRNRVRRSVIPAWIDAAGRDAVAGALLSRERLDEDDQALDDWTDSLEALTPAGTLKLETLKGVPKAVSRRALHRWMGLQTRAGSISRQGFEALLDAVIRGEPTRHSLGNQGFAVIKGGRLRFVGTGKTLRVKSQDAR